VIPAAGCIGEFVDRALLVTELGATALERPLPGFDHVVQTGMASHADHVTHIVALAPPDQAPTAKARVATQPILASAQPPEKSF
jgi:hypothetical protein